VQEHWKLPIGSRVELRSLKVFCMLEAPADRVQSDEDICRGCVNPVIGTGCASVDIGVKANLELVDKFCYLGNMLSVDGVGDADAAVETRI